MDRHKLSAQELAAKAADLFKSKADPARAAQGQKYFKERVKLFGLSSPEIGAIVTGLYNDIKGTWTAADAVKLCDLVFPRPELEYKALGAFILLRFKKSFPRDLFDKIKDWLAASYLDNWASVDVLCPYAGGALLTAYPELRREIKAWAVHPSRWVRRASLVSFIKLAKRPEFKAAVYEMARSHFDSEDDLIHKAAGWLLREAGKQDMASLEAFLLKHGPRIPRTTLRYAIERFPPAKRRALLLKTKK
jgi:3-methyladenine DNA glycosylase AlkD